MFRNFFSHRFTSTTASQSRFFRSTRAAAAGGAGATLFLFTTTAATAHPRHDAAEESSSSSSSSSVTYSHIPPPAPESMPFSIHQDEATGLEVHTLVPPRVEHKNIGGYVPCLRPCRVGGPRLEEEVIEECKVIDRNTSSSNAGGKKKETFRRFIMHNYGHGGAGWSLGPGCVEYAVDTLFKNRVRALNSEPQNHEAAVTKEEPIAVVGAGVIGLLTTLQLLESGYQNVRLYDDSFDQDIASNNAGGLIAVYASSSENDQRLLDDAAAATMRFFLKLMKQNHMRDGSARDKSVRIVKRYMGDEEKEENNVYLQHGVLREAPHECLIRFKKGEDTGNGGVADSDFVGFTEPRRCWVVDAMFVEVQQLMRRFESQIFGDGEQPKVKKVRTRIDRLDVAAAAAPAPAAETSAANELLSERFVFNCSGAGSRELVDDSRIERKAGHTVQLVGGGGDGGGDFIFDMRPAELSLQDEAPVKVVDVETGEERTELCMQLLYMLPKGRWAAKDDENAPTALLGGTLMRMNPGEAFSLDEFERIVSGARAVFLDEK